MTNGVHTVKHPVQVGSVQNLRDTGLQLPKMQITK
jgi:hypothetical protein